MAFSSLLTPSATPAPTPAPIGTPTPQQQLVQALGGTAPVYSPGQGMDEAAQTTPKSTGQGMNEAAPFGGTSSPAASPSPTPAPGPGMGQGGYSVDFNQPGMHAPGAVDPNANYAGKVGPDGWKPFMGDMAHSGDGTGMGGFFDRNPGLKDVKDNLSMFTDPNYQAGYNQNNHGAPGVQDTAGTSSQFTTGGERGHLKEKYMASGGDRQTMVQYMQENGYTPEMAAQELGIPVADVNNFLQGSDVKKRVATQQTAPETVPDSAIVNVFAEYKNDPKMMSTLMQQYGVSNAQFMRATGMDQAAFDKYFEPVFGQAAGGAPKPGQSIDPSVMDGINKVIWQKPTSGSGWNPNGNKDDANYTDPQGNSWHVAYNTTTGQGEESGQVQDKTVTTIMKDVVPGHNKPGDEQDIYSADGKYIGRYKIPPDTDISEMLVMAAVIAAGAGVASGVIPTAGAATGAGAGATGATATAVTGGGAGAATGTALAPAQVVSEIAASTGFAPAASQAAFDAAIAAAPGGTSAITGALAKLGISGKEAATIAGLVLASAGGGKFPSYPSGTSSTGGASTGTGTGSSQGDEAAAFLNKVLPYVRPNSTNPTGSSQWVQGPDGKWTLNTALNDANKSIYDPATSKFSTFVNGIDPNQKAPDLIDDAGGKYSQALADKIYERTARNFKPQFDAQRRELQNLLSQKGMEPGSEGWKTEMDRFEKQMDDQIRQASMDAQIQAATQGLNEADFTNKSRTQGLKNSQDIQAQIASILAGVRNNSTAGLKDLTSQANAPTGSPGNVQSAQDSKYAADVASFQSRNQTQNDLLNALLKWGLGT